MTFNNKENTQALTPSSQQVPWSAGEDSQAFSLLVRSLQPESMNPRQEFRCERLPSETALALTDRFCEVGCVVAATQSVISMAALPPLSNVISREGDNIGHSDDGNRFFIPSDTEISPLSLHRNLMEIIDSAIDLISEDLVMPTSMPFRSQFSFTLPPPPPPELHRQRVRRPFYHHSTLSNDCPQSRSAAQ